MKSIGNNNQHMRIKDGTKHFIKHYSQNNADNNNNLYKIYDLNSNGKLVSKLLIKRLRSDHKGVFTCKCDDGLEAKYVLESMANHKGMLVFEV
jgi:hypothetical protein